MARLINLLGGHAKEDREVLNTLAMLDKNKVPVRIEIENTQIHFHTRITVKSATVIVAKPMTLREGLSKGGTVRFKVPNSEGKEVRMEVITPHFNLTSGNPVFLCKVPTEFAQGNLRSVSRFNTSKFTNVHLLLPDQTETFRIVDLSTSGCKIYISDKESLKLFKIGNPIPSAKINLGNKVTVELKSMTPRNHRGQAVGCQFFLDSEGDSKKYLHHLINSLEKTEEERFRT